MIDISGASGRLKALVALLNATWAGKLDTIHTALTVGTRMANLDKLDANVSTTGKSRSQVLTGSGNWPVPANVSRVTVKMVGGGQGGSGGVCVTGGAVTQPTAGGAGTATTFGSLTAPAGGTAHPLSQSAGTGADGLVSHGLVAGGVSGAGGSDAAGTPGGNCLTLGGFGGNGGTRSTPAGGGGGGGGSIGQGGAGGNGVVNGNGTNGGAGTLGGGGGGGGARSQNSYVAAGGYSGTGAMVVIQELAVTPGASIAYSVGTGGAGGAGGYITATPTSKAGDGGAGGAGYLEVSWVA